MSRVRPYAALLAVLATGVLLTAGATAAVPDPPTITVKPSNPSNQASPTFEFSDTDVTATFECRLESQAFAACTSPATLPTTPDGSHTFFVRAVNLEGPSTTDASYPWTIDTHAPTVAFDTTPSNFTNDSTPTFAFHADEASSFVCTLDSQTPAACTSPATLPATPDGQHTFTVSATDAAANTGQANRTWTIDATPPVLSVSSEPPNPSGDSTSHFAFSATDQTSVAFQCQLDANPYETCTSPKDYSVTDGTHTFTAKGADAAGNSNTTSYTWLVDTANPVVTITSTPRNPTNQNSASFSFRSNKDGSTFQCRLDSTKAADFSPCTSPKTYGSGFLGEGRHTFSVRATDSLKHTGPPTTFSWTIDLTPPPAPSIGSGPTDPTNASTAGFDFSDSEAGVTFGCKLDGGAFSACTSPAAYSSLGAGTHTFAVRATDPVGNTGVAAVYGWTVKDATAPGNVRSLKRTVGYGILKLTWSRPADADFGYVRVLVGKGSKAATGQLRTSVYKGTGTHYTNKRFRNGTYYRYAIISYDKAGNASRGVPVVVQPSVLLRSPRNGVAVHAPPRLTWAKVAKASFYNVQLFSRGRKVLSAWPRAARLGLKRSWSYAGRHFKLKKGTYVWFVWPGFGPRSKSRYGQLLGQSAFTVH